MISPVDDEEAVHGGDEEDDEVVPLMRAGESLQG